MLRVEISKDPGHLDQSDTLGAFPPGSTFYPIPPLPMWKGVQFLWREAQKVGLWAGPACLLAGGVAGLAILLGFALAELTATYATVRQLPVGTIRDEATVAETAFAGDHLSVLVELHAEPAARVYASAYANQGIGAAQVVQRTQAQLATIEVAQLAVLDQISRLHAQPLYRTQRVYNGIGVRIDARDIEQIRNLPEVKAVHRLVAKYPTNARSVPHIGAPSLWQGLAGSPATGEGISIAIVDTGVDYLHVDFGGPGSGYAQNDRSVVGDIIGYPGVKVIGGYDFVGDIYDADARSPTYQPIPHPDPDPMDCYRASQGTVVTGHGTHVAGTAAGYGVTDKGTTFTGPYSKTIDFAQFQIGPGVAPEARIYALKVFGCTGSSEVVDAAIEWAVDPNGDGDFSDHVDVLNMSLGSTYGSVDDPSTVASENAALVGVVVVASAGNDGDTFFAVGSPSVSAHSISVAAVVPSYLPLQSGDEDQHIDTLAHFSARGVRRGDSALKPDLAAPGLGVFSARAGSGNGGYASSGTSMAAPHVTGAMALLRQIHPDLGVGSAENGSPSWIVEDLKALAINTAMRDIRTGTEVSATLYSPTRIGGGEIDLVNALEAQAIAYNANDPGQVSVSFGAPEVVSISRYVKNIRVANKGASTLTFSVTISVVVDMPGVAFLLPSEQEITVAPQSSVDVPVTLLAEPTQMKRIPDVTLKDTEGFPRQWLSEETGYVVFSPTGDHPTLHVPIYASPRLASQMHVAVEQIDMGNSLRTSKKIDLAGQDLRGTATPTEVVSLLSLFLLQYSSVRGEFSDELAPFDRVFAQADLRHVGVASNYPALYAGDTPTVLPEDATIFWGIATHGDWTTPNEVEFAIFIDVDGDGKSDFRLYNGDQVGMKDGTQVSDAFITVLEDLHTGKRTSQGSLNGFSAATLDTAIYHTNVMVLSVHAGAIRLETGRSSFDYYVESYSKDINNAIELGIYVERTPVFTYDLAHPGLDLSGGRVGTPTYDDLDGTDIAVGFDLTAYVGSGGKGLLALHHHNVRGRRTQVVPIAYAQMNSLYLPIIGK